MTAPSDLWHTLECPCYPAFKFRTAQTFGKHFESQRHRLYELLRSDKELRLRIAQLENERVREARRLRNAQQQLRELGLQSDILGESLRAARRRLHLLAPRVETRALRRARAARLIALWIAARVMRRRADRASHRRLLGMCLAHLRDRHRYMAALRQCYALLDQTA